MTRDEIERVFAATLAEMAAKWDNNYRGRHVTPQEVASAYCVALALTVDLELATAISHVARDVTLVWVHRAGDN